MTDTPAHQAPPRRLFADPLDFRGETAVLTGEASGIGFSIVRRLVEADAFVIVGDCQSARTGEPRRPGPTLYLSRYATFSSSLSSQLVKEK